MNCPSQFFPIPKCRPCRHTSISYARSACMCVGTGYDSSCVDTHRPTTMLMQELPMPEPTPRTNLHRRSYMRHLFKRQPARRDFMRQAQPGSPNKGGPPQDESTKPRAWRQEHTPTPPPQKNNPNDPTENKELLQLYRIPTHERRKANAGEGYELRETRRTQREAAELANDNIRNKEDKTQERTRSTREDNREGHQRHNPRLRTTIRPTKEIRPEPQDGGNETSDNTKKHTRGVAKARTPLGLS